MLRIKAIGSRLSWAKPVLVVLGWVAALASLAVAVIAHGILVPQAEFYAEATPASQTTLILVLLYYAGLFGVSLLCGYVLSSMTSALIGYFSSYVIAIVVTGLTLDLPGLTGSFAQNARSNIVLGVIFTPFFPFALIIGLVGALIGSASAET